MGPRTTKVQESNRATPRAAKNVATNLQQPVHLEQRSFQFLVVLGQTWDRTNSE